MSIDRMLKGHELFQALSVDDVNRMSTFSSVKEYAAEEAVYEYNKPGSHLFMLMEGTIVLQLPANPEEFNFTITRVEKGELFGISSLLKAERYPNTAKCQAAARVLSIEARPFLELLHSNRTVGLEIITRVADIYFHRYLNVLRRLQDVVQQISLVR